MLSILDDKIWFPPPQKANEDGLLAIGGDLSIERLKFAYNKGIFPWYNDEEVILWWHPNPRFVLFPKNLKVSKSMQQVIRSKKYTVTFNKQFEAVINACKSIKRNDQDGTWLNEDMIKAYCTLHQEGIAQSVEVWKDDNLVGGLYGIKMGNVFFGESMFSNLPNASKFGFIQYVQYLKEQGVNIIDCQVYTKHLESLGAEMIERTVFLDLLQKNIY